MNQNKHNILSILANPENNLLNSNPLFDDDNRTTMYDALKANHGTKNLTQGERKIFQDWFSTGNKEHDDTKLEFYKHLVAVCNGYNEFIGSKKRNDACSLLYSRHIFTCSYAPSEVASMITDDNARVNEINFRYQQYFYNLFLYGISTRQLLDILRANPSTKKVVMNGQCATLWENIKKGQIINGYSPLEIAYISLLMDLDDIIYKTPSVKREVIKTLENNLNQTLHIDSYKKFGGLQVLSKVMERYYAEYGSFEKLSAIDRTVVVICFELMMLTAPWQAVIGSCYMDWVENCADIESEKSDFIAISRSNDESDKKEIVKYRIDEIIDKLLSDECPECIQDYLGMYESIITYFGLTDYNSDTDSIFSTFLQHSEYVTNIKEIVYHTFDIDEWNKLSLERRCFVVTIIAISICLKVSVSKEAEFIPDTLESFIGYSPEITFEKKTSVSSKKAKKKQENKELHTLKKEVESVKNQNESLIAEIESLKKQLKNSKDENKSLRSENHEINQTLNSIKSESEKDSLSEEERNELNRLREYVFEAVQIQESETSQSTSESDENIIRNAGNLVILGGHTTLCRKIVDKYPNVKWIDGRKRFPFDLVKQADHVFFLFDFLSHGTYYEGCKICTQRSIPFSYIQGTNLERAEEQIIKGLKQK